MEYDMESYEKRVEKLEALWKDVNELNKFAQQEFGIDDIFQDNNGKVVQQLIYLNFKNVEGREGNDGRDKNEVEWEMKSVNINKTQSISTHHHLNKKILQKYRLVPWSFSVYEGSDLQQIYVIHPTKLDNEYFTEWENKIRTEGKELNNPKINLEYIKQHGTLVYCKTKGVLTDPTLIYDDEFMQTNINYDFSTSNKRPLEDIFEEFDQFIYTLSSDITHNVLTTSTGSERIWYSENCKPFVVLQKNKDAIIIYLNIPNVDYDDFYKEIKQAKKVYAAFNCRVEQKCMKGNLTHIKELIFKSYTNNV